DAGVDEYAAGGEHGTIDFDLGRVQDDQEIGLAGRDHGAENARAEANVAGDGAAALAHAVNFAFLNIDASEERDSCNDVRRFQHALTAQASCDDVSDFA